MNIGVIAALFSPYYRGGAEIVAQNAVAALALDHEVFVVTIGPWEGFRSLVPRKSEWHDPGTNKAIPVYRFYPLNIFSFINIARHSAPARLLWHFFDMFNLHTFCVMRYILKKETPDVVCTHNLKGIGYTVPLAIRSCKFLKKWIHTIHDLALLNPTGLKLFGHEHDFTQTLFIVKWYAWLNRMFFGSPGYVVSPSKYLLGEYLENKFFSKSHCVIIPNPVAVGEPSVVEQKEAGVIKFLYLGQLESYKGLLLLLETWSLFRKSEGNVELHILGAGSLQNVIDTACAHDSSIIFHGSAKDNASMISDMLKNVHVTIVPTLAYESFSMAVAESICAGVPVIASRIGAIPELVEDGVNGFLFTPGDVQDLMQTLQKACRSQWNILHNACLSSGQRFSVARYKEQLASLL